MEYIEFTKMSYRRVNKAIINMPKNIEVQVIKNTEHQIVFMWL